MSKYHVWCSCTNCKREVTIQSLKAHHIACTTFKRNCKQCATPTNNPEFCSRSCRTRFNNLCRIKKPKIIKLSRAQKCINRFLAGEMTERATIRKQLAKTVGYHCAECQKHSWRGIKLVLIVDHIDDNAGNNNPSNLRLLCPDCNSLTSTFGGKNKGKGRKSRGLPLN